MNIQQLAEFREECHKLQADALLNNDLDSLATLHARVKEEDMGLLQELVDELTDEQFKALNLHQGITPEKKLLDFMAGGWKDELKHD